jgi:hypothetical protein
MGELLRAKVIQIGTQVIEGNLLERNRFQKTGQAREIAPISLQSVGRQTLFGPAEMQVRPHSYEEWRRAQHSVNDTISAKLFETK